MNERVLAVAVRNVAPLNPCTYLSVFRFVSCATHMHMWHVVVVVVGPLRHASRVTRTKSTKNYSVLITHQSKIKNRFTLQKLCETK
jgi:hypothetical protein